MVRTETIIAVENVPASSSFYQKLLGCSSAHGGDTFEILTADNNVILCLHKWGEHAHPTLLQPKNAGNGLILFFRVDNLQEVFENATQLDATFEKEIHYNEKLAKKINFILRDPDNYYLMISE